MKKNETVSHGALAWLPTFVEVAKRQSFSAAARALSISTSAASQAIGRLEEELGQPLFLRTTRSVQLTDAGARLLEEAAPALERATTALTSLKTSLEARGTLRLTAPHIVSHMGLPELLARVARGLPKLRAFLDCVAAEKG